MSPIRLMFTTKIMFLPAQNILCTERSFILLPTVITSPAWKFNIFFVKKYKLFFFILYNNLVILLFFDMTDFIRYTHITVRWTRNKTFNDLLRILFAFIFITIVPNRQCLLHAIVLARRESQPEGYLPTPISVKFIIKYIKIIRQLYYYRDY